MSLKIGNYLKFFIKPCVMAVHLPLHGYISIYFTNAHGRNGQLIKSYVTETSSPPPPASPVGHGHSDPVTDGKERALRVSR